MLRASACGKYLVRTLVDDSGGGNQRVMRRQTWVQRLSTILSLGLPIVGAVISQNILNVVDTAMVGSLGDSALAAVGLGALVFFVASSSGIGLSSGVQSMVARRWGQGRSRDLAEPLNGAVLIALSWGLPMGAMMVMSAGDIFAVLSPDEEVAQLGSAYFRARGPCIAAMGVNFAFRGYWNAIGKPTIYLNTILLTHVSNICLNGVFIYGWLGFPPMGTFGAGLASCIATYIGSIAYIVLRFRWVAPDEMVLVVPKGSTLLTLLRLLVPSCVHKVSFSLGLATFFWIITQLGTREAAATHVINNLTLIVVLPGLAFGQAAGTLAGQALGRKELEEATRWGVEVAGVAMGMLLVVAPALIAYADVIVGFFIKDPLTRALGVTLLRCYCLGIPFEVMGLVFQNALAGTGSPGLVLRVSLVLQWCLFLPLAYWLGMVCSASLLTLWLAQIAYRVLQSFILANLWLRGTWREVRLE
ncbi:MAG: MATE family efflux transporter [Myxococcales bacterium]|nr:MATE family efflux transporter [Myxococcales bacterium]